MTQNLAAPPLASLNLPDALLDLEFGGRSVRANLEQALAQGILLLTPEGRLTLASGKDGNEAYQHHKGPEKRPFSCQFLMNVLFKAVYAQAAVPWHCRECYKVKIAPRDFKGLMALRTRLKDFSCSAKCGAEASYLQSQDLYGGYFYCQGMDHARDIHRRVREAADLHADLGPQTPLRIKRGCTLYEIHCGPSHAWTFTPEQELLEQRLLERFVAPAKIRDEGEFALVMRWMKAAHAIGDDSYLAFTKGVRAYPISISYDPATGEPVVKT